MSFGDIPSSKDPKRSSENEPNVSSSSDKTTLINKKYGISDIENNYIS